MSGGLAASGSLSGMRLFDEDFLARLERLRLAARRLAPGALRGEHRSKRRGRGIEFADYRPYVPGDDIRDLDWGAYLRFDKLLLRLLEEEGDLPLYLFVDGSASMTLPDPVKFDRARQMAAAFAYIALNHHDRVHLVVFDRGIRADSGGLRGSGQIVRLLRHLEAIEPSGVTDLRTALTRFFAARRRRGLVVVLSDLLSADVDAWLAAADGPAPSPQLPLFDWLRAMGQDLLLVHLETSGRDDLDRFGELLLVDAETGEELRVDLTPGLLQEHRAELDRRADELEAACRRRGWSYVRADAGRPFDDLVMDVFRRGRLLG
ncbi:MAG TPA: DUF58 domain-containing protein [Thermoanaerobaculia bacterium]|nr:DUF58 domain-containing protein [Thermoanaerobaculia bacterium]